MQIVPFDEDDLERGAELRSDQAFAGARNAHDHVEPSVASAHEVAPILYHRRILGYSAGVDRLVTSKKRGNGTNATGDDRVGPDGRQHGTAPGSGRA